MSHIQRNGVIAVITAYDPDSRLRVVLDSLRGQVDRIVVVDDGSTRIDHLYADESVELIHHAGNRGIAAALNTGISRAMQLGAAFVLTVDQDSVLAADYVASALAALSRLGDRRVASIGAWVLEPGASDPGPDVDLMECRGTLQSGMLMPTEVIPLIGRFREALFIDGVETEYVLRAQRAGYRTFVARGCEFDHRLGTSETLSLLGRSIRFPLHSAVRRYYITRNRLWLAARYGARQPRWFAAQSRDVIRVLLLSALSPRGGLPHIVATALGAFDFLRGHEGRIPVRFERALTTRGRTT